MFLPRLAAGVLAGIVAATAAAADPKPVVVKLAKLSAPAPAGWKAEKPANLLRDHQFKLPSGDTDVPDAEVIVYKEGSPNVDQKFKEWKATFVPPEGMTADDISKVSKLDLSGATANVLDVTGTWKYRERPRDPKSKEEIKPDYRVVWVILIQGDETKHLRLSGPKDVVAKYQPGFESWLKAMK